MWQHSSRLETKEKNAEEKSRFEHLLKCHPAYVDFDSDENE
jgi:hypothetical protein